MWWFQIIQGKGMNENKLTFELFKGKEWMKLNWLLWQIFSSEGVCKSLGIESFLPWVTHVTSVIFLVVVHMCVFPSPSTFPWLWRWVAWWVCSCACLLSAVLWLWCSIVLIRCHAQTWVANLAVCMYMIYICFLLFWSATLILMCSRPFPELLCSKDFVHFWLRQAQALHAVSEDVLRGRAGHRSLPQQTHQSHL